MPNRVLPPIMNMPTHDQGTKPCMVTTSVMIATVELPDGQGHCAALVINQPDSPIAAVAFLDRDELEAQTALLQNAVEDAELANAGKPLKHAPPSTEKH